MTVRARANTCGLVVAALVALSAGCGLSTNGEPERIPSEDVPSELADGYPSATAGTAPPGNMETESIKVWFVQSGEEDPQLVPVDRFVVPPVEIETRLLALTGEPPTDAERDNGISSAIPTDTGLEDVAMGEDGVVIVNLTENFFDLQGTTSRSAFAQIVCTVTEQDGAEQVRFQRNGEDFEAVDGEGQSHREPVGREAYACPETAG